MSEFMDRLIASLKQDIEQYRRALLVIDGDCGSGKTTLAVGIAKHFPCTVFHMDDFFLPPSMRTDARLAIPGGNIHYERFRDQVLQSLLVNQPIRYDSYSCRTGQSTAVSADPMPAVIIEGSYSLHPVFLPFYQALHAQKLFLYLSEEEQLRRIVSRNGEAMLRRFQNEWIPMEKQYQEAFRSAWNDVLFTAG